MAIREALGVVGEARARPLRRLRPDLRAAASPSRSPRWIPGALPRRARRERRPLRPGGRGRGGRRADRGVPRGDRRPAPRVRRFGAGGDARPVPDGHLAAAGPRRRGGACRPAPTRSPPCSRGATSETSRSPRAAAAPGSPAARPRTAASSSPSTGSTRSARSSPSSGGSTSRRACTTGRLQETVRGSGLMFAPDPGAPEQSQVGGNIATNAGGPHAFKYGVVGEWVTGLEAAIPPGELVTIGGRDPKGRRRLRPEAAADRLRGDARHRHRRVAQAASCAGGGAAGRDLLSRGGRGVRGDARASSAAGSSRRRSSCSTARRSPAVARPSPAGCPRAPGSC